MTATPAGQPTPADLRPEPLLMKLLDLLHEVSHAMESTPALRFEARKLATDLQAMIADDPSPVHSPEAAGQPTPGPWAVIHDGSRIVVDAATVEKGVKGIVVKSVALCGMGGVDEHEANARLIAAAPALLDALERAFIALGRAGGNTIDSPYRAEWEAARAAIQQATEGDRNG